MSYSAVAGSALFSDAQLHDNEKSEQALNKELKASHHLMRNNPIVRIGATRFRASCIGGGAKPVFSPELFSQEFLTSFEHWQHYCDFSGHSNFAGVQALALMTAVVEGRAFIVRRRTLDYIPLQLEVVSPLSLATNLEKAGKGSYVRGGILYAKNGKPQKYAFYKLPRDHPEFDEDSVNWLPASDVIDIRDIHHPGQSGAQPWISAGADFAKQYKDNQTVEIKSRMRRQGQQVYALRDVETAAAAKGPTGQQTEKKVVHKVGGITVLNGVKDIKTASPPEIAGNYQEHNSQVLRMVAGLFGIPYEMLTGDLTQVNYSSIRAGMINHRRFVSQFRSIDLEPNFNRIIGWFCDAYHLTSNPVLPGYFENPYTYITPIWVWPEWEEIDPLKAAKALVLELQQDITSLEKISNQRGSTLDQHLDSVKRSKDALDERGLINETPAAVDDEQTDADDD
ncbi:phage portal protein [Photobacterium atrarenae]|uniref:Phage portal protein n=1 Tax=Photobacterium atrarenae TaxID=865757 RepID=A0ABY5GB36_9GAMM|nr:phage portal protein [Photobacterium atrarenae]UTV26391.1 phage portal protein [Photobacterium atrarenae]